MYDVCTYPANLAAGKPVNSAICMQIRNSANFSSYLRLKSAFNSYQLHSSSLLEKINVILKAT